MSAGSELTPEFLRVAAARRLFGRPDLAAARSDPASARARQHRLIAATGGVESPPAADDRPARIAPASGGAGGGPLIYLHGGGLVFYDVAIYRPWLQLLADGCGREIVAIAYPKSPEAEPAAILETIAGAVAACADTGGAPPALAGDSVGGLIALWLCAEAGIAAERLVLIAPVLNLREDPSFGSYAAYGAGFGLDAEFMRWFRELACKALAGFDPLGPEPFSMPLPARTFVASPACDLLADEAAAFAELMARRSSPVGHVVLPGLPHDFWLYPGFAAVQRASLQVAALCRDAAA